MSKRPASHPHCAGPGAVEAEYRHLGQKLLKALSEPDTHIRKQEDRLLIIRLKGRVSVSMGDMPAGVLAPLLSSGAVRCQMAAGSPRFVITDAGHAALRRLDAGKDAFGNQHRLVETRRIDIEDEHRTVRVNLREDPLELLSRQTNRKGVKLIGQAAMAAAERFRRDLAMAGTLPRITANWSRLVVDGAGPRGELSASEARSEASRRVRAALDAVGPDFSGLLLDCCGFYKGLEVIEQEHGLPLRSGKVVVAFALRALARHYGLGDEAHGPEARGIIRQWGAEDYRPKLGMG